MDKFKKILPTIAISSLFIIVFNVLAFILATDFNKNFWCGYIFITLSWLSLLAIGLITATDKEKSKAIFLNAPSMLISIIHLLIQTVTGIFVMAISFFNVKVAICFEILIFAIYLGIIGVLELYKSKNK